MRLTLQHHGHIIANCRRNQASSALTDYGSSWFLYPSGIDNYLFDKPFHLENVPD